MDLVKKALFQATVPGGPLSRSLGVVRQRVDRLAEADALLLPPENFHISKQARLRTLFYEMRNGHRDWSNRLPELVAQNFTQTSFPRFSPAETRTAFKDDRDFVFLRAHPTAFHGSVRELLGEEADWSETEMRLMLQSLFRFGAALPSGFHHDVQREHSVPVSGHVFDCGEEGAVRLSGKYVNVYPDDFVRGKNKRKI